MQSDGVEAMAHERAVKLREIIRKASGESLDLKAYEADMRHLIDTYIEADEPRKISPFDNLGLLELIVKTGIGEAIVAGIRFLKRDSERSKIIILVTDGDNSSGRRPWEVAPMAVRDRVKVYSILIGPEIVTPTAAANHELNRVARLTGGQFFQAVDTRGLESIYNVIDQLEKKELVQKRYVVWQELFPWLVGAAAILVMADQLLRLRRRLP